MVVHPLPFIISCFTIQPTHSIFCAILLYMMMIDGVGIVCNSLIMKESAQLAANANRFQLREIFGHEREKAAFF